MVFILMHAVLDEEDDDMPGLVGGETAAGTIRVALCVLRRDCFTQSADLPRSLATVSPYHIETRLGPKSHCLGRSTTFIH